MRRHTLYLLTMLACVLALLAACGTDSSATHQSTPAPSGTAATASPASRLTPANVPSGWLVYDGPHFAIAYPPDWTEGPASVTVTGLGKGYRFDAPGGFPRVIIFEADNVDATSIQQTYCASLPGAMAVTVAGLAMQFMAPSQDGTTRTWQFITSRRTVYTLYAVDGTSGTASNILQGNRLQDDGLLSTFTPDDTTSACP